MRRPSFLGIALAALLLLPLFPSRAGYDLPALEKLEARAQAVAQKAAPSIVAITHPMRGGMASGSGTIIGRNGLILTAAHVLAEAERVNITFPDGKTLSAKVLGADYDHDVALAQITEPGSYPFLELGDAAPPAVGEMVVALGHPGGFDSKRPAPLRLGRVFSAEADGTVRTDCALAGGDSGGALLDLDGKVIGVHHAVGASMSSNLDAPASAVRKSWDRMLRGERWGGGLGAKAPELIAAEKQGLRLSKFRERILREAMKTGGVIATDATTIGKWLKECGMPAKRVDRMKAAAVSKLMESALSGVARVSPFGKAAIPKLSDSELAGLDLEAFRERVTSAAARNGGVLATEPKDIAAWLREGGMKKERVAAMSEANLLEFVHKALAGIANVTADEDLEGDEGTTMAELFGFPEAVAKQDKEIVSAMQASFDRIVPAVVSIAADGKEVAMGTIIREDGFILTKHSDVMQRKGALSVRLSDGRTATGTEVHVFPNHDLCMVKIDLRGLAALELKPEPQSDTPGRILFTPSNRPDQPMLAMGVSSTHTRSLRESGGYVGIALRQAGSIVLVDEVVPHTPGARGGLRKGDQIVAIDQANFTKADDLTAHVRTLAPGTDVQFTLRRGKGEVTKKVTLGDRGTLAPKAEPTHPALNVGTEVSQHRHGFPSIFQHDQPLEPTQCGSVVIDLRGKVVGVNIARANRVSTYAIPTNVIVELLASVDFATLR